MAVDTPLAVGLAIIFLVPGFLWRKAALITSRYATRAETDWFECLTLSCFNYLVGSPFIWLLLVFIPGDFDFKDPRTYARHPCYLLFWLLLVFFLPMLCGWLTSRAAASPRLTFFLRKFGIVTTHPAPTAWDYAFARDERYWARIQLVDGTRVEGVFDSNSLASGESEERDIFLESVFEFDEEIDDYTPVERNAGIWVRPDQIRTISFFTMDEAAETEEDRPEG